MNKSDICNRLEEIFHDVFDIENDLTQTQLTQEFVEDWDSIGHVRLIVAVEQEFDVEIPLEESTKFNCFDSIISYLEKRLG